MPKASSASQALATLPDRLRKRVESEMEQRAGEASGVILATAQRVLRGRRGGRRYRVPGTRRRYQASKPLEAPAKRTGQFEGSWATSIRQRKTYSQSLTQTLPGVTTDMAWLAKVLTKGATRRRGGLLVRRSFKRLIKQRARRKVRQIYRRPYLKGM